MYDYPLLSSWKNNKDTIFFKKGLPSLSYIVYNGSKVLQGPWGSIVKGGHWMIHVAPFNGMRGCCENGCGLKGPLTSWLYGAQTFLSQSPNATHHLPPSLPGWLYTSASASVSKGCCSYMLINTASQSKAGLRGWAKDDSSSLFFFYKNSSTWRGTALLAQP